MAGWGSVRFARAALALALWDVALQACAPLSPFASAMPQPASEAEQGLVDASGGIYPDRALGAYVSGVGRRLVAAAGERGAGWRFAVLDTPVANAFSLPGGRIYVTRGMLALANDEAELAAVLAHEIGHGVSGDAEREADEATRRASEFRADRLGMGYLEAAGYDAQAQVDFLATLLASHRLALRLGGDAVPRTPPAPSDHPALADRLTVAERDAAGAPPGQRYREEYLAAVDGLVWGDGAPQGFLSGRVFVHPQLGFAFDAPLGYVLANRADAVVANGPRGATFLLDSLPDPGLPPEAYLLHVWIPAIGRDMAAGRVVGLRPLWLNGLEAAQGEVTLQTGGSERVASLTVIRFGGRLYRLTGLRQPGDRGAEAALAAAALSFRPLSQADAMNAQPLRLRIHRVAAGEDLTALVEAMPVNAPRETFELLNEIRPGHEPRAGDSVKIIE